jgi:hypothetical protein
MFWQRIAERRWKEAQEAGAVDHLAGQGKPLPLEDDTHVPSEWRLAFHVLQRAGLAPDWVEAVRGATTRVEGACQDLRLAADDEPDRSSDRWQRALARFEAAVDEANALIDRANLRVPHPALQRPRYASRRLIEQVLGTHGG